MKDEKLREKEEAAAKRKAIIDAGGIPDDPMVAPNPAMDGLHKAED